MNVVVALFKKDGTSEMFDVEDFCENGESIQLNIYEEEENNED